MRAYNFHSLIVLTGFLTAQTFAADAVNYQDHVLPIFRDACLNCHNADKKKAGLDLSNFQAAMAGGNDGPVINAGDPDGSLLFKVVTHAEDPTMPPKRDKLPQKELDTIKAWIAGGALETKNGKPIASTKPKVNLAVANLAMKKPDGPPPMPRDLSLEPAVRASRSWAINCLGASPWAPVVAIGGQHQVLLYNPESLEMLGVVPFANGEPCVTRFSPSGKMLLIAGGVAAKSGKVALWDITAGRHVTDVGDEFDEVIAADISPDQTTVALGGPGKTLKLYSTADGSLAAAVKQKHTDWITAIAYSPDGVLLASADRAGGLWVWEAKSAHEFYNLAGHKAGVTAVAFRDDSNFLASASEDGTIKLWDMESGKNVKTWNAHAGGVLSLAFTHDGRLVSCGRDRVVKLWKPDGSQIRQLDAFSDIALQATFDHDGKRVIAGDWTGEVRVWDADTGKLAGKLDPNPTPISERIAAAQQKLDELRTAHGKAQTELAPLQDAAQKADASLKQAEAALAAAKKAQQDAQTRLTQAASAHAADESRRVALEAELDRLKAGEFFQKVLAARQELTNRQSQQEQAKADLAAAQADADKAAAALAAAEKSLADAPARVQTKQQEVKNIEAAIASAGKEIDTAKSAFEQKQLIVSEARELQQKLAAEAAGPQADQSIRDAAEKVKQVTDALAGQVKLAEKALSDRQAAAAEAQRALAAAQSSLLKEKQAAAAAPAAIAKLKEAASIASTAIAQKKSALEAAEYPLAEARAAAEQLNKQYEQMLRPRQVSDAKGK